MREVDHRPTGHLRTHGDGLAAHGHPLKRISNLYHRRELAIAAAPSAPSCADAIHLWSPVMLSISPLEFLAAFALSFLGGALLAACHCKHVGKVQREAYSRMRGVSIHA